MRRSKTTFATTLVTVAALGVFAGACSSSAKNSTTATSPSTGGAAPTTTSGVPGPTAITIVATDYAYSGVPATIPAGIVTVSFVNRGKVAHEMSVLKVTDNRDTKAIFTSIGKMFKGGPIPSNFLAWNGVHDTPPGKTTNTQFNLTPGNYIALCGDTGVAGSTTSGPPHALRGMYKQFTVTGTGGTTLPTAAITLTAHDYGFDVSQLKAGTQTVLFKNIGPVQWHFADINVFPKGTTVAQVQANVTKLLLSNGPPPPGVPVPQDLGGSQSASPGYGNTFTTTLETGRVYLVVCFFSDKTGGLPHALGHHMYKIFTVS
jgi:plastocyanin